jgi:hypothetical protein
MSPDDRIFDGRLKRIEFKLNAIGGSAIASSTIALGWLIFHTLWDRWEVPQIWAGLATLAIYIIYTFYALLSSFTIGDSISLRRRSVHL